MFMIKDVLPAVGAVLAAVTILLEPQPAVAVAPVKPNILVILVDDMGFSDIGCYGSEIPTPNLDRLASNGLRFTQFYNTGRCCQTRASVLTGLYPHEAGVGQFQYGKLADMQNSVWNVMLPPKDRVEVEQALKGKMPAKYAKQIKLYYQNLAGAKAD